jgi:predicted peptidase
MIRTKILAHGALALGAFAIVAILAAPSRRADAAETVRAGDPAPAAEPAPSDRAGDPSKAPDPKSLYEERVLKLPDAEEKVFRYRLLLPVDYTPDAAKGGKRWPLILFLHGAGERGEDNAAQLKFFPTDMVAAENRERYRTFILAPQCPPGRAWSARNLNELLEGKETNPAAETKAVLAMLDRTMEELPVDPDRVYLTGLSMGGFGSWYLAALEPRRWAAVVPICGGGSPKVAPKIKGIPIWVFHGGKDTVVPPRLSQEMVKALREAGGDPRYTEFEDAGHDSWTPGYRHPEFLPWLFAQRRDQKKEATK